jgi:hypothetical protein
MAMFFLPTMDPAKTAIARNRAGSKKNFENRGSLKRSERERRYFKRVRGKDFEQVLRNRGPL